MAFEATTLYMVKYRVSKIGYLQIVQTNTTVCAGNIILIYQILSYEVLNL